FCLDLVILAEAGYAALTETEPTVQALLRGFAVLLASGLLGVAVVLIASSWRRSALGLWVSLICGAVPLLWVTSAMIGGLFE
ncbi:MAG TPA: hypothetical protein VEK82_00685, partial [Stellaceae bacterium]|nr:hypothetical protein [Stellaceae bacterium]